MRDNDLGCGGWIVVAIALFMLWKWYDGSGSWTGWIYPDAPDLSRSVQLGEFKTFEQCQQAAIAGLRSLQAFEGDYECGRRCKFNPSYGLNVCKETRK